MFQYFSTQRVKVPQHLCFSPLDPTKVSSAMGLSKRLKITQQNYIYPRITLFKTQIYHAEWGRPRLMHSWLSFVCCSSVRVSRLYAALYSKVHTKLRTLVIGGGLRGLQSPLPPEFEGSKKRTERQATIYYGQPPRNPGIKILTRALKFQRARAK